MPNTILFMKILAIDVPALHLGYLGCYGNDWVATPNIDRLASESVVFDRHYYDCEQPQPFAGTGHHLSLADAPNLGNILKENKIAFELVQGKDSLAVKSFQQVIDKTIKALADGRNFVWARFSSMAPPWNLRGDLLDSYCEEEDEPWPDPPHGPLEDGDDLPRLQNTYAAVMTYVDARLGTLIDEVRERGFAEDTLICLTVPCGLPLGEHGLIGYAQPSVHEEFVHLPLMLRLPGAEAAGLRINALTQPVDLFATWLEFLNIKPPPSQGFSLWPLIRDGISQVRPHACSRVCCGQEVALSLRTLEWAFLLPMVDDSSEPGRLYVKPDDRWEVNDVRQQHMELTEEMEKILRQPFRG
jgi:arylsulfatase A-like enzyme